MIFGSNYLKTLSEYIKKNKTGVKPTAKTMIKRMRQESNKQNVIYNRSKIESGNTTKKVKLTNFIKTKYLSSFFLFL